MRFISGFLVGLVSGIGLFLGPIVAFIGGIAIGWKASSESSDEPQDPTTPAVNYQGMTAKKEPAS